MIKDHKAKATKTPEEKCAAMGALVTLAAHSKVHSLKPLQKLQKSFDPAISNNQFRFFQDRAGVPCAALLWAYLSQHAHRQLIHDGRLPKPTDWTSGDILWLMDFISPFGSGKTVLRHMRKAPRRSRSFSPNEPQMEPSNVLSGVKSPQWVCIYQNHTALIP